jgi:hypothetical protein
MTQTRRIRELHLLPPISIARLGASPTPMENYSWREDLQQFGAGRTVIHPEPSIEVSPAGEQSVYTPGHIRFRDGGKIRPVCPFLELWCTTEGVDGNKRKEPLTTKLLNENGASLENITYDVVAVNRKAARRTHDEACSFRAELAVSAADFAKRPLLAFSPNTGGEPLVWESSPIPLGEFQPLRPMPSSSGEQHLLGINLGTIRARFTPAKGEVYGPPTTVAGVDPDSGRMHQIVPQANRITNPKAAWNLHGAKEAQTDAAPQPTYDGEGDLARGGRSFGVVDDTCDVRIVARLAWRGHSLQAAARICCGPPDFGPDRRPFFSLADDFADRDEKSYPPQPADPGKPEEYAELQSYSIDLFRRIYETAALINVDRYRLRTIGLNQGTPEVAGLPRVDDYTMRTGRKGQDDESFLSSDAAVQLRNDGGDDNPKNNSNLVRHRLARDRHQILADPQALIDAILLNEHDLIPRIIRPPYRRFGELKPAPGGPAKEGEFRDIRVTRDVAFDMRMPPYMRDSDGNALSLTRRQYDMLVRYINALRLRRQTPAVEHREVFRKRREARGK